MELVAKVQKDGTIEMPRLKLGSYVLVKIEQIYIDPSTAHRLPENFKISD